MRCLSQKLLDELSCSCDEMSWIIDVLIVKKYHIMINEGQICVYGDLKKLGEDESEERCQHVL